MTNRHSFVLGLFITASLLCASRTVWGNSEINTYTKTDFAMDTVVSETLYTTGEDITADVISALKDVERELDLLDKRKVLRYTRSIKMPEIQQRYLMKLPPV